MTKARTSIKDRLAVVGIVVVVAHCWHHGALEGLSNFDFDPGPIQLATVLRKLGARRSDREKREVEIERKREKDKEKSLKRQISETTSSVYVCVCSVENDKGEVQMASTSSTFTRIQSHTYICTFRNHIPLFIHTFSLLFLPYFYSLTRILHSKEIYIYIVQLLTQ